MDCENVSLRDGFNDSLSDSPRDTTSFGTGKTVWEGRPSQWVNMPYYLIAIFITILPPPINVIGLAYGIFRYLKIRCLKFELYEDRIQIWHGILSRHTDNLNIYRVKDVHLSSPWWLRIVGLGNLIIMTSDIMTPAIIIQAVPNARELYNFIMSTAESQRMNRGVQEVDFR